MSILLPIFQAIEFIEANLQQPIAVADIAEAASYSLYHFCRMFNQLTHHTPYDYLIRRRLSQSAHELVETGKKIIEIALDYQFNNPETYSRAFKRLFGLQPYQWRKRGLLDRRQLTPRLTLAHLEHIQGDDCPKAALEAKAAFQVVGLMTTIHENAGAIPQLWRALARELRKVAGSNLQGNYYGLAWYPRGWTKRGFFYLAGVESEGLDAADSALVQKKMPPAQYARFVHKGSYQDLYLTQDYVYATWLPKSGRHLDGAFEIEAYGPHWPNHEHVEAELRFYVPIR